jgi:uncharacterized protein YbbC (DUF1343 family)
LKRQYQQLFEQHGDQLARGKVGVLCNQVSFDLTEGKYLFQLLKSIAKDITLFIPEHGLFAEQQDQVIIKDTDIYKSFDNTVSYVPLYGNSVNKLGDLPGNLASLYTLIIDIQDVGVRYYTYVTTIGEIFKVLSQSDMNVKVVVIDRRNPAGSQVEGTILTEDFSSLIGLAGLPHRYGLTIGELCNFLKFKYEGQFQLEIIKTDSNSLSINPSPNIPSRNTCLVFSGQCLLEGTNLSEGRGTTRPFEIFGAPFLKDLSMSWVDEWNKENPEAVLRPLLFVPTFHKHKDKLCYGFQLHPGDRFHSLLYTLKMLRSLKEHLAVLHWLEGPYEAGSDKPAIELLVGDKNLMGFLNGSGNMQDLSHKLKDEEREWIDMTRPFMLYPDPLISILK